ncbi:SGNH/GDSL hydrolase family protein [Nocardia sp. NPDC059240]|uniref:SGNH/GDSL hydrolase family protein n=1 Tax=Nocardia sp. NPDC059240 TaxID=3346786 RepID=UPI00368C0CE4
MFPLRLISLVAACGALTAPASAAAPEDSAPIQRYVALGDSAAAVGSLDRLETGVPLFCARSDDNYPSDLARKLAPAQFVDATCSSAKTTHMTQPQTGATPGSVPPQFDALTPDTDLVTITIGANDIGALGHQGAVTETELATMGTNVGAVLDGIHQRAPHATVVVLPYIRYAPPDGPGCYGFSSANGQQRMADTLAATAAAHHARFADIFAMTGHDMCEPAGTNWVNGPLPDTFSVPLHPNAVGQSYAADVIARTLS